jgi:hypothetical protein
MQRVNEVAAFSKLTPDALLTQRAVQIDIVWPLFILGRRHRRRRLCARVPGIVF